MYSVIFVCIKSIDFLRISRLNFHIPLMKFLDFLIYEKPQKWGWHKPLSGSELISRHPLYGNMNIK